MGAEDQRSFVVRGQIRLTAMAKSVCHSFEATLAGTREQTLVAVLMVAAAGKAARQIERYQTYPGLAVLRFRGYDVLVLLATGAQLGLYVVIGVPAHVAAVVIVEVAGQAFGGAYGLADRVLAIAL
jgi:hypothetical protein